MGVEADDLDGVEHRSTDGPTPDDIAAGSDHPNGSALVDHVVVATPDMGRTEEEFGRVGLDLRRVREVPGTAPQRLQAFYRTGEVVLEVVGTLRSQLGREDRNLEAVFRRLTGGDDGQNAVLE